MGDVLELPVGVERGWRYLESEYRCQLLKVGANPKKLDLALEEMRNHYFDLEKSFQFSLSLPPEFGLSPHQSTVLEHALRESFAVFYDQIKANRDQAYGLILALVAQKHGAI